MTAISNKIEPSDIFVAGARATGSVHIGNYFGAIQNFVTLSEKISNPTYFFIADWHSLTTHTNAEELARNNYQTLATYLGCGLNPDKAVVYFQSDITGIAELYLYLNMFSYKAELERTATFKEKIQNHPENVNAGLLTYPVLMAADVLIHRGTKVPVGKDQAQHVEMIRTFGNRFNYTYKKELFKEAYPFTYSEKLVSIPSLSGKGKMSKSDDESTAIYLMDSDADIERKIKKAVTDTGPKEPNTSLTPEMENLFSIMRVFSEDSIVQEYLNAYSNCSIRYGDMKKQIAADCIRFITPIRENIQSYLDNPKLLHEIALSGAEKANLSAKNTLEEVRDLMGLTSKNIKNG